MRLERRSALSTAVLAAEVQRGDITTWLLDLLQRVLQHRPPLMTDYLHNPSGWVYHWQKVQTAAYVLPGTCYLTTMPAALQYTQGA